MARPRLQLLESQIRYAMENTCTNSEAAKWLHITSATFKKYALRYIDEPTGKTLWLLHKERGAAKRLVLPVTRYRRLHTVPWAFQPFPIADIFANKHPKYSLRRFYDRIVKEGYIEERCSCCGFQERRLHDYEIPLKLHWLDGDRHNYAIENIQMLCFNCYFNLVRTPSTSYQGWTYGTASKLPWYGERRKQDGRYRRRLEDRIKQQAEKKKQEQEKFFDWNEENKSDV